MIQAKKTSIAIIFALLMLITYDIVQADQRELSHKDSLAYYSYGKDRVSQKNLNYGVKFMQEYLEKPGAQKTESGMVYQILTEGNGAKPASSSSKVRVNYQGRLISGKVFDDSYKRGEPAEFGLNQVIGGWTEILQLMPVGSTWEVVIPPELAYGSRGIAGVIPENSVLIFKIELLGIVE